MTTLRAGAATSVGQVRANNQDSYLRVDENRLYGVADGIGGHQGGEVASALAVELIAEAANDSSLETFVQAVRDANRAIFEKAGSDRSLHGMGTTFVGLQVTDGPEGDEIGWVNVGDSRLYLLRDDEIIQISEDHSLVEELVRDGQITAEEAKVHPQRNIVTRSLGIDLDVYADADSLLPFTGDRYLLCSDGLSNEVTDEQMAAVLRRLADPEEAASELVRLANEAGGRDNITVVIVDVVDDGGRSAAASAALAAQAARAESMKPPTDGIDREADTAALPIVEPSDAGRPDADGPAGPAPFESSGEPQILAGISAGGASDGSVGADDDPDAEPFTGQRSSLPASDDDFGTDVEDPFGDLGGARTRRITWRVIAFFVALAAIAATVIGVIGWQANNSYFVAYGDDQAVTIYRGRPGGVLFFDPSVVQATDLTADDIDPRFRDDIRLGKQFDSEDAAQRYVSTLESAAIPPTTTEASATTTTAAATTTSETGSTSTTPEGP